MPEVTAPAARSVLLRWAPALATCLLAALAVAPALRPGAEWYMDNSSHLLEVQALSQDIAAGGNGFVAWTTRAELGLAVGQVSAPLPWTALAWITRAGVAPALANGIAIVLSNVLFAIAVSRLALRLYADRRVAWFAGALASCVVTDLYGIGGTTGGMWPYRLANALVLFAFARGATGLGAALLLGLAWGCHTLSASVGMLGGGVFAVVGAVRDARDVRWGNLVRRGATLCGAVALGSPVWWSLLDPALRDFGGVHPYRWGELVLAIAFPVNPFAFPRGSTLLGGPFAIAVWALGLALALVPARGLLRDASAALALGVGLVILEVCVALPSLGGPSPLGPVPFRLHVFLHVALAVRAGAGAVWLHDLAQARVQSGSPRRYVSLGAGLPVGVCIAAALAAAWCGMNELPDAKAPAFARQLTDLRAAWALASAQSKGAPVYLHDTFANARAPAVLYWSHPGGLLAAENGASVLGSWYGISGSPVTRASRSEDGLFVGSPRKQRESDRLEQALDRLDAYGVCALVTWDKQIVDALTGQRGFATLSATGAWTVLSRDAVPTPVPYTLGASSPGALTVDDSGPDSRLVLPRSYNPAWTAHTVGDGREAPVPLAADAATGLLVASPPPRSRVVLTIRP